MSLKKQIETSRARHKKISQVISAKGRVEYSTEMPSQKQALNVTLQAERSYKWARQATTK